MPGPGGRHRRHNRGVRIAILGLLEVHDDGGAAVPVAGARLRGLITRLALAGGKPVSTSALAEAVWDFSRPPTWRTPCRRSSRGPAGPWAARPPSSSRRPGTGWRSRRMTWTHCALSSSSPRGTSRRRSPVARAGAGRRRGLRRAVRPAAGGAKARRHRHLARPRAGAGRAAAHVGGLEALAAEHPLNEKVTGLLMRALAATGRQADALAAYEALRARLADELGIDPGPQLQAIHLEVLRGEIAGGAPAHTPAAPRTNLPGAS